MNIYIQYDPEAPVLMRRLEALWRERTGACGADKIVDDWKRGACELLIPKEQMDEIISSHTNGSG